MIKYRYFIADENKYIYFDINHIHNEEDTLFWRYKIYNIDYSFLNVFVWIDSMWNDIYTGDIVMRKWIEVWYGYSDEAEYVHTVKFDKHKSWYFPFCDPLNEWWKLYWHNTEDWTIISNIMECNNHIFNPYR